LLFALTPWNNKDSIGQILFGAQSILFFGTAYIQQKKVVEINKKEDNK